MGWLKRLLGYKPEIVHQGFLGEPPYTNKPVYTAHLTPEEQARVEQKFNPKIDSCPMDTIYRLGYTDQQRGRR